MSSKKTENEAYAEMVAHGGSNLRVCGSYPEVWLYDTHVGLCLQDREANYYDDSDWYMLVWNPETNDTKEICFASTRGWTYPCYGSSPDATPEVKAAANAYFLAQSIEIMTNADRREARTPKHGKEVRVIKGYTNKGIKVEAGSVGDIFWTGESKNFSGSRFYRPEPMIGFRALDGTRTFTKAANVEVINPEQYEKSAEDIKASAPYYAVKF